MTKGVRIRAPPQGSFLKALFRRSCSCLLKWFVQSSYSSMMLMQVDELMCVTVDACGRSTSGVTITHFRYSHARSCQNV